MADLAFWASLESALVNEGSLCLAVLVSSQGSAPNLPGAKMFVVSDGRSEGTVGGGVVEHQVRERARERARELVAEGKGTGDLLDYEHRVEGPTTAAGTLCSGRQSFALVVLDREDRAEVARVRRCAEEGRPGRLVLRPTGLSLHEDTGSADVPVWKPASDGDWSYEEQPGLREVLTLVGGGHVSRALSTIAATLGFHVVVLDDRDGVPTMRDNHDAHEKRVVDYGQVEEEVPTGPHSYVCIMTAGHRSDEDVLAQLIRRDYASLAMMGSKKKVASIFANLVARGVPSESLATVNAPAGLPIRSRTPAEIAVSIAAQLVEVRANRRR